MTTPLLARLQAEQAAAAAVKPKVEPVRPHAGKTGTALVKARQEVDRARVDLQPVLARCGLDGCDWSFEGTVGEGRELARQHRERAHPGVRSLTRGERKKKEIEEARRLRAERDAQQRGLAALERMDAGERQQPVEKIGEGEPGANGNGADSGVSAAGRADGPHDRADDAALTASSSPTPRDEARARGRKYWTPERVLDFIHAFVAAHGHTPRQTDDPGFAQAAKVHFGNVGNACVNAGYPRPSRGIRNRCEPLGAVAGVGPAPAPSGSGVDEQVITSTAGETAHTVSPLPEGLSPGVSEQAGEPGREPDGSGDSRAPQPPEPPDPPPSTALTVAHRDPIRTADIPYDAGLLEDEAAFLRARADALDEIAGGLRKLAVLTPSKEV